MPQNSEACQLGLGNTTDFLFYSRLVSQYQYEYFTIDLPMCVQRYVHFVLCELDLGQHLIIHLYWILNCSYSFFYSNFYLYCIYVVRFEMAFFCYCLTFVLIVHFKLVFLIST